MFQFQCPQGHLLEGEESQAGEACTCPTCGVEFIIPAPVGFAEAAYDASGYGDQGAFASPGAYVDQGGYVEEAPYEEPAPQEVLLHISCPSGHVLETPRDMLNQEVLCPHCNEQFRLLEKDSSEYKERVRVQTEKREIRTGNLWMYWAIGIAVLVVLGLIGLIASSGGGR